MRRVSAKFDITATDKTSTAIRSASKGVDFLKSSFAKLALPIAGLASIGGLTALIKNVANTGDELRDMSLRTGETVENLSALDFAAKQSGTSLDSIAVALKSASNNMLDVSRGTGEARRTFDELGLSVYRSDGRLKSSTDLMIEAADKIVALDDETRQLAYANDIFGKSAMDILPFLKQGSAGIRELMDESKRLGIQWTTEGADAADEFNDALGRIQGAIGGVARIAMTALMPPLTEVINKTAEWVGANKEFIQTGIEDAMNGIVSALDQIWQHKDTFAAVFQSTLWIADKLLQMAGAMGQLVTFAIAGPKRIDYGPLADPNFNPFAAIANEQFAGLGSPATASAAGIPAPVAATAGISYGTAYAGGLSMTPGSGSQLGLFTGRDAFANPFPGVSRDALEAYGSILKARDIMAEYGKTSIAVTDKTSHGWLSLSDDISMVLANSTLAHENFFRAVVKGYEDMFAKLTAIYAAKSTVFGIFNLFGGADLLGGNLWNFLFPSFIRDKSGGSKNNNGSGGTQGDYTGGLSRTFASGGFLHGKLLPSFAGGGIVSRPTLALIGDDPAGPERVLNAQETRDYERGAAGVQVGSVNLYFTEAEKREMVNDTDRQFAEKFNRCLRLGYIRMGVA